MEKRCTRCGQTKPLELFKKDSRASDGRDACCKECAGKSQKAYRERPDIQKRDAERARQYKNPRVFYRYNPEAQAAHNQIKAAIRMGLLPKASERPCRLCSNQATEYHHHNGYGVGHELDVIPLCRSCHRLTHNADS